VRLELPFGYAGQCCNQSKFALEFVSAVIPVTRAHAPTYWYALVQLQSGFRSTAHQPEILHQQGERIRHVKQGGSHVTFEFANKQQVVQVFLFTHFVG